MDLIASGHEPKAVTRCGEFCLSPRVSLFFFLNFFLLFFIFIYLFIYLWLCWVFVSVRGLSLVAASGGHSFIAVCGAPDYRGLSCCGAQAPDAQAQ